MTYNTPKNLNKLTSIAIFLLAIAWVVTQQGRFECLVVLVQTYVYMSDALLRPD